MALSANTVWEVRTGGADTNGGGFVTGASGTDWSQQDAAQYSVTDGVTAGTTTITSATANFGTDVVGNIMYVQGGTGSVTAGWYQIISRTDSTTIVVDRSTGLTAGTGVTLKIGGALASPGMCGASFVSGNIMYIKAGTYTITSASTNVTGGCFSKGASTDTFIEGYQTTRGDLGTPPLIQADGVITTFTLISLTSSSSGASIRNINVDGNSRTSSRGINWGDGYVYKCKGVNCTNSAFRTATTRVMFVSCWATGCSTAGAFAFSSGGFAVGCVAQGNTITGFTCESAGSGFFVSCLSYGNTGASSDGFQINYYNYQFYGCVAYANGRDGFRITNEQTTCINCVAEANTGTGFNVTGNDVVVNLLNCAYYNNGTNVTLGTGKFSFNIGGITGTGSFFTNAAGGDFTLNNTAGGGADLRSAGYPGELPVGGTGYVDIGALQVQASAAGGGGRLAGMGGIATRG